MNPTTPTIRYRAQGDAPKTFRHLTRLNGDEMTEIQIQRLEDARKEAQRFISDVDAVLQADAAEKLQNEQRLHYKNHHGRWPNGDDLYKVFRVQKLYSAAKRHSMDLSETLIALRRTTKWS